MSQPKILTGVVALILPALLVSAQSPEMPEPQSVLLDVDGKPMVQIIDITESSIFVLFDFDGVPARFTVGSDDGSFSSGSGVFFSEPDCAGEMYLSNPRISGVWEFLVETYFSISGPHSDDGTYRVFRSTSLDPVAVMPASVLTKNGECIPPSGPFTGFVYGKEILPNPLDGYHGPSNASPGGLMTVRGGTRLP